MKDMNSPYFKTFILWLLPCACGAFYLFYYHVLPALREIISFLFPIITPFIIGGTIAALMEPVVRYLEIRFHMKRSLAALVTLVTLLAALIAIIAFSISWVSVEVVKLSRELPTYFDSVMQCLKIYWRSLNCTVSLILVPGCWRAYLRVFYLTLWTHQFASGATNFVVGTATILPNIFLILIISLLAAYFSGRDKQVIGNIVGILPSSIYEAAHAIGEDMGKAIFVHPYSIIVGYDYSYSDCYWSVYFRY